MKRSVKVFYMCKKQYERASKETHEEQRAWLTSGRTVAEFTYGANERIFFATLEVMLRSGSVEVNRLWVSGSRAHGSLSSDYISTQQSDEIFLGSRKSKCAFFPSSAQRIVFQQQTAAHLYIHQTHHMIICNVQQCLILRPSRTGS